MPVIQPRPPLIPAGSVLLQHAITGVLHLQTVICTFYTLIRDSTPQTVVLLDAAQKLWEHFRVQWQPCVSQDYLFVSNICRVVGFPEIPSVIYNVPANIRGTVISEALPSTCAAIITRRSTHGGKRGRGRVYIPGIPEAGTFNSTFTAGHQIVFADLVNRFLVNAAYGDFGNQEHWVWSRNKGAEAGVAGARVVSAQLQLTIGTQRRRRIGRGI